MTCHLLSVVLLCAGLVCSDLAQATSLAGSAPPEADAAPSAKDAIVKKYVETCKAKSAKDTTCDALKKEAVEILKEDLHTLGSSADRTYIPFILTLFKSDEPELRIAAADALGMIGPQDAYAEVLGRAANDPVPRREKSHRSDASARQGKRIGFIVEAGRELGRRRPHTGCAA